MAGFAFEADDDAPIAAINTTPLVDVMLVLLIVFLIAIPVVTASLPLRLPRERVEPRADAPQAVVISVDASGTVAWGATPLGRGELTERLRRVAAARPQPEVQLRGDLDGAYEGVGRVLEACRRAGIERASLVTDPNGS